MADGTTLTLCTGLDVCLCVRALFLCVVLSPCAAEADEDALTQEEQNLYLTRQVEALKLTLVKSENKSTLAEVVVRELRSKLVDLQRDYEEEKRRTYALASDMTRQYKRKVEDMMREKSEEEQLRMAVEDKLAATVLAKDQLERDLLQRLQLKEAEILEQKSKMDEMAHEFGQMLKATLDKMSEKIEVTSDFENAAAEEPIVRTFSEFNLAGGHR